MKRAIVINGRDNVATALADLEAGEVIEIQIAAETRRVALLEAIRFGHKFAISPIGAGDTVIKYGESIGASTEAIAAGSHVHVHNLASRRGRGDLE